MSRAGGFGLGLFLLCLVDGGGFVIPTHRPSFGIEVAPFQWTVFGFASYVPARVTSRSASYAMGDR